MTYLVLAKSINADARAESQELVSWASSVKKKLGLKAFDVYKSINGDLKLGLLIVPKDSRKQGTGSAAVEQFIAKADEMGLRAVLTPALKDKDFGTTSRSRLVRFYKRFGFVENSGRNKDFTLDAGAMYRMPKQKKLAAAKLGTHPDLFGSESDVVLSDWKQMSPSDLRRAAKAGELSSEDLEDIVGWQEQAEADGDLDALLAEGMTQQLAEAVSSGLAEELYELDELGAEARIEEFVKYWRDRAEWDIKYETEEGQDGYERVIDEFNDQLDDNVSSFAKQALEQLEEYGYEKVDQVTEEMLADGIQHPGDDWNREEVLKDPTMYKFELTKDQYRSPTGALDGWSWGFGELYQSSDGPDYDDELARLLRPLSDKDVRKAMDELGNNSPYIDFGRVGRNTKTPKKDVFRGSIDYTIGETEGWSIHALLDMKALTEKLDSLLDEKGPVAQTPDNVVYRFSGTNDTVAGADAKGMYVVSLRPDQLGKEGASLGICVGRKDMPYCRNLKAGTINLYSIRTESGKPKFTVEENVNPKKINQVKGQSNRVPGFASGSSGSLKPNEVRLVAEFLMSLGYTSEEISRFRDTAPGVEAMLDAGQDPFTPPKVRGREKQQPQITASFAAQQLAAEAMAHPWGYDVQVVVSAASRSEKTAAYAKQKLIEAFGPRGVRLTRRKDHGVDPTDDGAWVTAKVLVPMSDLSQVNQPTAEKAARRVLKARFGDGGFELGEHVTFDNRGAWVTCVVFLNS